MRRVARVTEDLGRGDGAFYVEQPDIPEGLTCKEWRVASSLPAPPRSREPRRTAWPALRPRVA
jgi:hypothetical protein